MNIEEIKISRDEFDDINTGKQKQIPVARNGPYLTNNFLLFKEHDELLNRYTGRTIMTKITNCYHCNMISKDFMILSISIIK